MLFRSVSVVCSFAMDPSRCRSVRTWSVHRRAGIVVPGPVWSPAWGVRPTRKGGALVLEGVGEMERDSKDDRSGIRREEMYREGLEERLDYETSWSSLPHASTFRARVDWRDRKSVV